MKKIKGFFLAISNIMQLVTNFILLIPVYFIGIGLASVFFMAFKKKTYYKGYKGWVKIKKEKNNYYRMF